MGIFSEIVYKARTTTDTKEAKKIRNLLLFFGIIILIIGIVLWFGSFIGFAAYGSVIIFNPKYIAITLISFFLGFFLFSFGIIILRTGLSIVVVNITSKIMDTNNYCDSCGDVIREDELYCSKCGKPLLKNKICKYCGKENLIETDYCVTCGKKLE